jgi:hypothetical protein
MNNLVQSFLCFLVSLNCVLFGCVVDTSIDTFVVKQLFDTFLGDSSWTLSLSYCIEYITIYDSFDSPSQP